MSRRNVRGRHFGLSQQSASSEDCFYRAHDGEPNSMATILRGTASVSRCPGLVAWGRWRSLNSGGWRHQQQLEMVRANLRPGAVARWGSEIEGGSDDL